MSRPLVLDLMALHAYAVPVDDLSLHLYRIEVAVYTMQSMMSTLLAFGGMGCHGVQLQTDVDKVSPMESGLPEPDQSLATVDETFSHAVRATRLRRMRAKAIRKKLWHESRGHRYGKDHTEVLTSAQTVSAKEAHGCTLQRSCQTDIEGKDVFPMSMAEELSRMTAERTTETMQMKFESQVKDLCTKFEKELTLSKDRVLDLEKQLSQERVRANALVAEVAKKDAGHLPCVIAAPLAQEPSKCSVSKPVDVSQTTAVPDTSEIGQQVTWVFTEPKRRSSAFFLYCAEEKRKLHGNIEKYAIIAIQKDWHSMPEALKSKYELEARRQKERYEEQHAEYKKYGRYPAT